MFYKFKELSDGTTIVYSAVEKIDLKDHITVKMERWNEQRNDFDSMDILLPEFTVSNLKGYSLKEQNALLQTIKASENIFFQLAKEHKREERQKAIDYANASMALEGYDHISAEERKIQEQYINGELTLKEFGDLIRKGHR